MSYFIINERDSLACNLLKVAPNLEKPSEIFLIIQGCIKRYNKLHASIPDSFWIDLFKEFCTFINNYIWTTMKQCDSSDLQNQILYLYAYDEIDKSFSSLVMSIKKNIKEECKRQIIDQYVEISQTQESVLKARSKFIRSVARIVAEKVKHCIACYNGNNDKCIQVLKTHVLAMVYQNRQLMSLDQVILFTASEVFQLYMAKLKSYPVAITNDLAQILLSDFTSIKDFFLQHVFESTKMFYINGVKSQALPIENTLKVLTSPTEFIILMFKTVMPHAGVDNLSDILSMRRLDKQEHKVLLERFSSARTK